MNSKPYKEYDRLVNQNTGTQYRILADFDGNVITCQMDTSALRVFYFREEDINIGLSDGTYVIKTDHFQIMDLEQYYSNSNNDMKQKKIDRFILLREICSAVYDEYKYKLYELTIRGKTKDLVKQLCDENKISRQTFWKYFTRYLQSGLQDTALVDTRGKTVRSSEKRKVPAGHKKKNGDAAYLITDIDRKKFQKHLKRYLKSEVKSKENTYLDLVEEDYSTKVKTVDVNGKIIEKRIILPANQRPTRRQFFYYIKTHSTKQERREAKETKAVVRNNARVFTGTVMDGVRGPGHYVEIDAHEMDISLISEEYEMIPVGRPILYVAIDVMSEIILAVSLAMDNNSVVGCTNCMMNLIEDKEKLLERHGISIAFNEGFTLSDVWPTGVKPRVVKFDNGSDFISKEIARILKELNIRAEFVSPATGSLKPLVENFFGTIKRSLDDLLEHKGLIRPTYGSKHHEEACLLYDDAYKIILNHVLYHNSHILTTYAESAEMKERGIVTSPMELWRYGNQVLMPATMFVNRDDALYHMLKPCKDAKLSRFCINRNGLPYFNASDAELQNKMFTQGDKTTKFECRYDPRDMGHLYYLKDGKIQTASLPSDDYRYLSYYGMSEKRFEELEELSKEKSTLVEELNTQSKINKRHIDKKIIGVAAKKRPGKKKVKAMKQARKIEKEIISGKNSVSNRFDFVNEVADDKTAFASLEQDALSIKSVPEESPEQKRLRIMKEAAMMDEEDM